ncbi:MAG: AraC family transcriptional regulator [Clostridia bacterium]|nr:AraC family transcriptional regulator [Clostridia bacterium]
MNSADLTRSKRNENVHHTPHMPDEYPFWLCQYGHTFKDKNYHEITFKTDIYRIEYVISGRGYINSKKISTVVEAGDTYILHEGDDHNYYSDFQNPMDKIWFNCHGVLIKELMKIYKLDNVIIFKGLDTSEWINNMHKICQSYSDPYILQTKTSVYFLEFIQFLSKHHLATTSNTDRLESTKAFIDLHIQDNITIAEIAHQLHMSQNHLIRLFKERYDITPHQYIIQSKLAAAKIMLRTSDKRISDIADELNFMSPTSFSDIFFKKFGMRPLPYRQQYKSQTDDNII